jgi:hypothetical protein
MKQRKKLGLLAPVALAGALAVVGCDAGSQLPMAADGPAPQFSHTPAVEECATVDFNGFTHGQVTDPISVTFPSSQVVVFDVAGSATAGGYDAVAFDVNIESAVDPDIQDDDGAFGYCNPCNGQGNLLVIGSTTPATFASEGDHAPGGTIVWTRDDGEEFRIAETNFFDIETTELGISLTRNTGPTVVIPASSSTSSDGGATGPVSNTDLTFDLTWTYDFAGSGAIDDIEICVEPPDGGGEGCTPGYWKQEQHFDSWTATGYSTADDFCTVFGLTTSLCATPLAHPESGTLDDLTLLDALKLKGGGINALVRHAVAALLNASSPGVSFDLTSGEVISGFQSAIDGGDIDGTKDTFEGYNEQGCPLD